MELHEKLIEYLKIIDGEIFPNNKLMNFIILGKGVKTRIIAAYRPAKIDAENLERYVISTENLLSQKQFKPVPMYSFYNSKVDFRKREPLIINPPYPNQDIWLASIAAHECRHRFQIISNNDAAVNSFEEYKAAKDPLLMLAGLYSQIVDDHGYDEADMDLEVDARVVEQVFMREMYLQMYAYGNSVELSIRNSAHVVSKNLEQLKEVLYSSCLISI
jgi:hypothetical protein